MWFKFLAHSKIGPVCGFSRGLAMANANFTVNGSHIDTIWLQPMMINWFEDLLQCGQETYRDSSICYFYTSVITYIGLNGLAVLFRFFFYVDKLHMYVLHMTTVPMRFVRRIYKHYWRCLSKHVVHRHFSCLKYLRHCG